MTPYRLAPLTMLVPTLLLGLAMAASAAEFPMEIDESSSSLAGTKGWNMKTSVKLSDTARLDGSTTLVSKNWTGFNGGVVIFLLDSEGNILHRSSIKTAEVGGAWFSEQTTNRVLWSEEVPEKALEDVARVKVLHQQVDDAIEWTSMIDDTARVGASLLDVIDMLSGVPDATQSAEGEGSGEGEGSAEKSGQMDKAAAAK